MANHYAAPRASLDDVTPGDGVVTTKMVEALRGTKGWVMFIGVLLFIATAFLVLGGVGAMAGGMLGGGTGGPRAMFLGMGLFYVFFGLLYVFLGLYLVRYASAISQLISDGRSGDLENALDQQRKFWRLAGISVLVMFVFSVIGIMAAIAIPMMAR